MNKAIHFDYFSLFVRRTEAAAIRQELTFTHQRVEKSIVFITYLNESSINTIIMRRLFRMRHPFIVMALFLTWNGGQIPGSINEEVNCINLKPGQKGFIQLTKEMSRVNHWLSMEKLLTERQTSLSGMFPFFFIKPIPPESTTHRAARTTRRGSGGLCIQMKAVASR